MHSTDVSTSIISQRGILAQSGMTHNIVSTAFQSHSRKPTMNIANGQAEGRNTIPLKSSLLPHTDLQGMVSSSLTRQLNSLNITSAASEQERGQLGQTAAGGHDLALIPLEATTRQGQGAATRVQVIACNSTDQSKRGYVVRAEVDQCAGKSGSESNATGAHQEYSGTSGSDLEVKIKVLAVLSIRTETLHSSRNSGCSPSRNILSSVSESRYFPSFMTTLSRTETNDQNKNEASSYFFSKLNYFHSCNKLQVIISPFLYYYIYIFTLKSRFPSFFVVVTVLHLSFWVQISAGFPPEVTTSNFRIEQLSPN